MPERQRREARTIAVMVSMYCRAHHGDARDADDVCASCAELVEYAHLRLERCRYGVDKPTCTNCPTHCYRPEQRQRVREVMRYSGPRMLRSHPVMAVRHLLDGRRRAERRAPSD